MNKHSFSFGTIIMVVLFGLSSCEKPFMDGDPDYNHRENFEYLWNEVDQKYSYFDVKNIDWDEVYTEYSARVNTHMTNEAFFNLMFQMLGTLRDGHVNLRSSFNVSRYNISYDAPEKYNGRLLEDYYLEPNELNHFDLAEHSYITGPLKHQLFPVNGHLIGYIQYGSFSYPISDYDIDYTLNRMRPTTGLIIDVRQNGGGAITNIFQMINRLTEEKHYLYGTVIKDGPEHDAFGELMKVYNDPEGSIKYTKPVVILTNRNCYSATTFFAAALKAYQNVTQIGDTTGGGAGAPHGGQMPNGWYYRFSVTRSGYPNGDTLYDFETGVPPDVYVNMEPSDEENGHDTMIDTAITLLINQSK